ncbi:citrate synthase [Campylobacter sp. RM9344]|uniref:Citrate synthase n=1 Tax=Campylobacter californiensis TaxID=1032243 RepID=A0AAW3ZRT5_9BACT|nr:MULTISPECIES: citrate synthase [unclassified Campylobacter]MBE2984081.1 citrate synthase [Campylobacter sp. RM6883]MBE2987095.1 citrate synthase [Campylobacter sp. RM12919]MBE2988400.1 citrate synthase [Campylobacter sp. RM12920]MBE2995506.1 citrate synthase [Campylobacter sp. RM6913]MBE3021948.1 citrate synthase [Campylobacter sp. 7477a]MBE3029850.1 citrate synthase [Campylobacter sp. RM9344]
MANTATLTDNRNGKSYEFPILQGTMGPDVIDISTLFSDTGMFTFDRGYTSTAMCRSQITYIDGLKGELMYRGYDIAYLAEQKTFLDVAYLLLNKELPNPDQYAAFKLELKKRSFIHEGMLKIFDAFPDKAHPMAILQASVSALSAFYSDHLNMDKPEEYHEMAMRIIAKIPTIAAFSYRYSRGLPIIYPNLDRGFTENFLYMMRSYPYEHVDLKPIEVKALDTVFSLHADHEQNASTTTVRTVGSTHAHPYACIAAGIGALWGWAHGGANEGVIRQLEEIGSVDKVDHYIARAKDKNDPFRLMGFGHRVYKNFDPRAKVLKKMRDQLIDEIGINSELIKVANRIEEIALNDDYFVSRNLYPNVDFHSGLILKALGIPNDMFAVIFVIGRTPGWISQWIELKEQDTIKIVRPRQLYVGETNRTPKC